MNNSQNRITYEVCNEVDTSGIKLFEPLSTADFVRLLDAEFVYWNERLNNEIDAILEDLQNA